MKKNMKLSIRFAMLAAGLMIAGAVRADAVTDNAKALLDKGEAKAAYALLEPLEPQRAGDPEYDFLLGLAALEIGKNTNAVFALERVLAVDPNHARARAEIARAYAALGEASTAKQEFEAAKRQGVPPEVANTIDRMLAAIDARRGQGPHHGARLRRGHRRSRLQRQRRHLGPQRDRASLRRLRS